LTDRQLSVSTIVMTWIRVLEVGEIDQVEVEWWKGHTARCYECGCCILIMTIHALEVSIISTRLVLSQLWIDFKLGVKKREGQKEESGAMRERHTDSPYPPTTHPLNPNSQKRSSELNAFQSQVHVY
jgi:hypothetical protein